MADVTEWTADQLMTAISNALKLRDFEAVTGLLHLLAVKDPNAAQDVYDILTAVCATPVRAKL